MPKSKDYERNPNLPDEVNDCLELLLGRLPVVPNNCWPSMRMTVTGTWTPEQRQEAITWCDAGGDEPDCVFELRQGFARIVGIDPTTLKRLE